MTPRKPEGGQVHKLTVTFRSWIPQEEEAWGHLVAGSVVGFPAAARARNAIIAALVNKIDPMQVASGPYQAVWQKSVLKKIEQDVSTIPNISTVYGEESTDEDMEDV